MLGKKSAGDALALANVAIAEGRQLRQEITNAMGAFQTQFNAIMNVQAQIMERLMSPAAPPPTDPAVADLKVQVEVLEVEAQETRERVDRAHVLAAETSEELDNLVAGIQRAVVVRSATGRTIERPRRESQAQAQA